MQIGADARAFTARDRHGCAPGRLDLHAALGDEHVDLIAFPAHAESRADGADHDAAGLDEDSPMGSDVNR
jgi:hypothetical protein